MTRKKKYFGKIGRDYVLCKNCKKIMPKTRGMFKTQTLDFNSPNFYLCLDCSTLLEEKDGTS